MGGNNEYIDQSSATVGQLFNNMYLRRYTLPHKVLFNNISEFKRDLTPLLKYLDIKPVLTTIKNPQAYAPVERVHQVILNILDTKGLSNQVFDYMFP